MRSYGQYCGLAKALDRVGDRWTLLIVRELLVESRRYGELREALPGIATNLLAQRLRDLEREEVVARMPGGAYRLTPRGRELEPAVAALVRFGGHWMGVRARGEAFRPGWLVVALRAMLRGRRAGRVELHVEGGIVHIRRGRAGLGPVPNAEAVVAATAEEILGVAAGRLDADTLRVRGDRAAVRAALAGSGGD